MVLAILICTLPAVTIASETVLLHFFFSGYSINLIIINFNWAGEGRGASGKLETGSFHMWRVHKEGYGPGNKTEWYHSADSLTCMNTTKCHTNPSPWNMAS